jgi:hypothetical protein
MNTPPQVKSLLAAFDLRGKAQKTLNTAAQKHQEAQADFAAAQQLVSEAKSAVRGILGAGHYRLRGKLLLIVSSDDVKVAQCEMVS